MLKKVVTFGVFLCALSIFSPMGECKIPPQNLTHSLTAPNYINFNHYAVQNQKSPIFVNQRSKFHSNLYTSNSVKTNNFLPFWNKNKNISKIGNNKVEYRNNLPYKIGNKRVIYGPDKRIKAIGNQRVYYQNGRMHKIGNLPVIYNNDNEIIRIGNWSVSYNA